MPPSTLPSSNDSIARMLRIYAQNILVVLFGLLPLVFIPTNVAPFEYTKILIIVVGVLAALVLFSLATLRAGSITFGISYPVIMLWVIAGLALVSSLFSGDFRDSFTGDVLGTQSTAFLGLIAIAVSLWLLLEVPKGVVMRLYMVLSASTLALVLYHVIRLFAGPDALSFGIFTSAVASPIGNWNDLALFLGLSVILSLVAIEQLPLTFSGRTLFGVVTLLSLFMLGVINFFIVWIVLGLTSLALVVYGLTKDRFGSAQPVLIPQKSTNMASLTLSLIVFAASVLFIIGGANLGAHISKMTNISYVEVRPSLSATIDIARGVYKENAFFGIGPSRFSDAWRLYKDPSINTTIFWNTDFIAGNGYVTTFFVTMGILGGLAWVLFLGFFLYYGLRLLFTAPESDPMWYFIGLSSFVSAVYIWGMSVVYVPGAVVLLIGAVCTAVMFTAYNALTKPRSFTFSITANRRVGFLFTLFVIAIIVGSVSLLYGVGRHYAAAYTFNESVRALQNGESLETVEGMVLNAYTLYPSDTYARRLGEINFTRLSSLLGVQQPTEEQQTAFNKAIADGVTSAQQAVNADPTESQNYAVIGNIYSILTSANIEGVSDRAVEMLMKAREYNPQNPMPYLDLAISEGRIGNFDSARSYAESAINLKPNYTDAIFYLSQLDIVTGNVDGAINSTRSIISLEPQNPARYYQLGVLLTSKQDLDGAILAFERAIALDQNYANARYLLALAYDAKGRGAEAKAQLEKVLELNPGNQEVETLIRILDEQGSLQALTAAAETNRVVDEAVTVTDDNGTVSTNKAPDSPLVSPVNVPPNSPDDGAVEQVPEATAPSESQPTE